MIWGLLPVETIRRVTGVKQAIGDAMNRARGLTFFAGAAMALTRFI